MADDDRNERLKWSKRAEYEARKELSMIATKQCDSLLKAFSDCAQEQGLLVVLRCRQQNRAMNECLHQYTNEKAFEDYKRQRSSAVLLQQENAAAARSA